MFVELHMIQNFAPCNLNRDDTNSPKECEFGGYRRARISSQCIKRAIRMHFKNHLLFPSEYLASRTKRVVEEVAKRLIASGKDPEAARTAVKAALRVVGLAVDDRGKTQYLLFLGNAEIQNLAQVCSKHWDLLSSIRFEEESAKARKKAGKKAIPRELQKAVEAILDGGKAADLALFGRMLADKPEKNIDAACQVAHAISTNKVSMEFDFYTAVDDLQDPAEAAEGAGAGMMGTVEFNSSCFYRYSNVDADQLKRNLSEDEDLTRRTIEAFIRASVAAIPTGKQNSMAAQNPPSLVFAVLRDRGLWSLANAFIQPIRPDRDNSLVQKSIEALDNYWGKLVQAYGDAGIRAKAVVTLEEDNLSHLADAKVKNLDELVSLAMKSLTFSA